MSPMQKIVSGHDSFSFEGKVQEFLDRGYDIVPGSFHVQFAPLERTEHTKDYFVCVLVNGNTPIT